MLSRFVKHKFGKKKEPETPSNQFYSPLRIGLHSSITINTVDWIVLKSELNNLLDMPTSPLEVLAIGTMDIDGTKMYNIYLQDAKDVEFILRLICSNNQRSGLEEVDEATLYQQVVTMNPETEISLNRILSDIGFEDITVDDVKYNRIWGDRFTEQARLREFPERLIQPQSTTDVLNQYLLYGRLVTDPVSGNVVEEKLLVGIEEDDNTASVVMQVGYPNVQLANIEIL